MADKKDDISKDAAANLQKAAQTLAQVSKQLEKSFAKSTDYAKAMTDEIKQTNREQQKGGDILGSIRDLNKDLRASAAERVQEQKIQNLALKTGQSTEMVTLRLNQLQAVQKAKAAGASEEIIQKINQEYEVAKQLTKEYEDHVKEQEMAADLAAENEKHTEALKDKLKEITGYQGVFKDIFTDGRLAAGIFLNQVAKGMKTTTELFDHARHEGMTVSQAFHETGLAISDSFSLTGASAKDSMEVMSGMRAEMGTLEGHTRKARLEAASLAKSFGISNEEAGKLTASLSMMPGATMDTANDTARFAANMAKAAGAAPGEVLKDMSKNGEAFAKYGKDGGKNMATMAVAAKKIGMEMGPLVDMTENLLDFENSIEKQMEASVLLGREINLDKARQLALEGDLAGATKEVLANVGGEAEFNQMNAIQRKALADSMGVSVGELQKMVKNQDKLNDLSEDQQAALEAGEVTMDELMANAGGLFDKLKNVGITVFSMIKGFSTLKKGLTDMVDFAKQLGIESFAQVKALVQQGVQMAKNGVMAAIRFAKDKAKAAWDLMTGKTKMAMDLKAHLLRMSQKAKEFLFDKEKRKEMLAGAKKALTGGAGMLKSGGKKGAEALTKSGDAAADTQKSASKMGAGGGAGKSLKKLADGVGAFGKGKVILGALVGLPATALGMVTMVAAIPALAFLALAGIPAATGLKALAKGVEAMGKGKVAMGALMIGVLGLSMMALGAAAMLFAAGGAAGTMLMVVSMYALVGALALMGGLGLSGVGFIGVALVLAMGVALLAMGLAVKLAAEGMAVLVEAFIGLFGAITLENLAPIFLMGPALALASVGMIVFSGALFVLAFAALFGAPALIALGAGMLMLGLGVKFASEGLIAISEALPKMADGVGALGAVAPMLALASLYILQLGVAGLVSAPGIFVGAAALGIMTIAMAGFAAAVTAAIPGVTLLLQLGSMADSFALIAESMFAMAAGITAFAMAGLLTLPTIMGLIALSFVAPILTLLGDSINYDLGGGSSVETKPEDAKMDMLIEEVRQLRAAFQTPGVINMDGQKVGDVIGLAVSTSGVA